MFVCLVVKNLSKLTSFSIFLILKLLKMVRNIFIFSKALLQLSWFHNFMIFTKIYFYNYFQFYFILKSSFFRHLKKDLADVISKTPEEMPLEEKNFHYFRIHDTNNDQMIG